MANKIKGGVDYESVIGSVTDESKTKTVNLSFTSPQELELFTRLQKAADEDERTLSRYIVRFLRSRLVNTEASPAE